MRHRIVDVLEHHVFEGDEIPRRHLQVPLAGSQQFLQRILAIERHELVAQRIVAGMQRNRQCHRAVFRQTVDQRHHTGGGNRDPAARKPVTVVVQQRPQGRQQRVVVQQRLAHAHEDDVADGAQRAGIVNVLVELGHVVGATPAGLRTGLAQELVGQPDLTEDLGRAEVAREPLLAGGAEAAVDGTPGLRGHAERATTGFGDEDGLNGIAGPHVKEPLARGIGGGVILQHRRCLDQRLVLKALTEAASQIGHGRPVGHATLVHPAHELVGTKGLFTHAPAEIQEALAIEPEQIDGPGRRLGSGRLRRRCCGALPGRDGHGRLRRCAALLSALRRSRWIQEGGSGFRAGFPLGQGGLHAVSPDIRPGRPHLARRRETG